MQTSTLQFSKATATGNDFVLLDARASDFDLQLKDVMGSHLRTAIVQRLCDRHFGVGADGVVFLHSNPGGLSDLKWDFYNSDGSPAEMCGNAARCFALFARELGLADKNVTFMTTAGLISAAIKSPHVVEVTLTPPRILGREMMLSGNQKADWIDSGVPHVVIETHSLFERETMIVSARRLRHDPAVGTMGANVTFRKSVGSHEIESVTFERGVEGFTLSCGTGAVAAAVSQRLRWPAPEAVTVRVPGGTVEVELSADFQVARLRGPAQILFTGYIGRGWTI